MSGGSGGVEGSRAATADEDVPAGLPRNPSCPFCDGSETELFSPFGSHASVATYWCRLCRSPFEIFKWRSADSEERTR